LENLQTTNLLFRFSTRAPRLEVLGKLMEFKLGDIVPDWVWVWG
jgi:hypothetical protein